MNNILNAILNLTEVSAYELKEYNKTRNRANNMGGALEEYIKDIFAGTMNELDESTRMVKLSEVFSYTGNLNNPPDSILKKGDAIEVKKIESYGSQLALNSSYPKSKLYQSSDLLTIQCKNCEVDGWTEKDIIYTVGVVNGENLSDLFMVYGIDYAASEPIYANLKSKIKDGITTIENLDFSETNELGRVNRVDPLGITYLRVRGMWGIENPFKVFNYVYKKKSEHKFNFAAIINQRKFESFENYLEFLNKVKDIENLELKDIGIKCPDNPVRIIEAKLITYSRR